MGVNADFRFARFGSRASRRLHDRDFGICCGNSFVCRHIPPPRDVYPFLRGTFAPFLRALESPMAMACLRLFDFPFFPPRCWPRFVLWIAFLTSCFAFAP